MLSGLYLVYCAFFTVFLENEASESMPWLSWIISALAIFFIIMELAKLRHRHGSYFLVFSNYLELCAFVLPICCVWIPGWDKTILRPASVLFVWFRILLQLRVIKPFGIFVAVTSEIVRSMIPFLVVLVVVYMGFVQAFYEFFKYASPQTGAYDIINGFINNTPVNFTISPFDPSGQNFSQDLLTVMSNVFFFTTQNYGSISIYPLDDPICNSLHTLTLQCADIITQLRLILSSTRSSSSTRGAIELTGSLRTFTTSVPHDTKIAAYKKMTIRDHPEEYEARQRQMIKWGPDLQFSDLCENIPDVVEVLWDYNLTSDRPHHLPRPHHLQLKRGECIDVVLASPSGWWYGECGDKTGLFPCNFVGPCTATGTRASGSNTTLAEVPDLGVQNDRRRLWYPSEGPLPIPGPCGGGAL
ncbi:hypothetical protein BC937DRAFT_94252 [Endogone sp. FLAS-F59071]|nr:hypothetical protein BC937DRAFT_94252 [Endogone sp. FLAS-F59071]|eukprot:RUS20834.1 hypothetical protein BC937DRAFT_94252 [Endogone sp. FLAS-F59071]